MKTGIFLCLFLLWGITMGYANTTKVVMIIAHHNFRDEELFVTKEILERHGVKVTVASSALTPAKGMLGGVYKPDLLVQDISIDDYDALIFVGGMGATEYWNSEIAHRLAHEAFQKGKVVAAICIAPVTLAKAGLLKDKRATVWSSEAGKLESAGAIYTGKPVEKDGLIITANGPQSAQAFAESILAALEK
ncbi:MAG: DJ-1/PfpI family protein [Candidatus Desulfofervidaceae bacterium]|nr:DJ-1/PfpI family protein [Candidatus Desulfofervidaceae bacterium]